MAASWTFGGVSKSGSPTDRLTISRPAAFNSVASAVIAIVGDGLTRDRRSARKDMFFSGKYDHANLIPAPGFVKYGNEALDSSVASGYAPINAVITRYRCR